MTLRDQLEQQTQEVAELKIQRTELRRLNGLLEKDSSRLNDALRKTKDEVNNLKRQANLTREELRILKEEGRNAKQQAEYAKESAQKVRAELERVKELKKDPNAEELKKLGWEAVNEARRYKELAVALTAERDKAWADLEAANDELSDIEDDRDGAWALADELECAMREYKQRSEELAETVKELRAQLGANDAPLHDSNMTVASGEKKSKSVAVKAEDVSPPPMAVATRSSKRKAATASSSKASKKARF